VKRPQRMLQFLLAGAIAVGALSVTTFADPPRTTKTPAKAKPSKTAGRGSATADRNTSSAARAASPKAGSSLTDKRDVPISKEREAAAVRFARKHHPELADLLGWLSKSTRKSDKRNFQAGLRALTRDAERLGKLAERKDDRYGISLDMWKLDSRIRLEIARLSMSPDEDFEPRLRPLMEEWQITRVRLIQLERKRLAERVVKYDEQLKTLQSEPDKLIGSEIEALKKLVASRARTKGSRQQTSKNTDSATPKRKPSKSKTSRSSNSPHTSAD
jgi:2-oxo-4-hydroxy-4-carboxy--5-ureidoimidazoline (OHCU) decarboxylase